MRVEPLWSRPAYEEVAELVRARVGLAFVPEMRSTVETRIREAMVERSVEDPAEYLSLLTREEETLESLIDRLTIGETYFFREPSQLEYIRGVVLPELSTIRSERPLRVWSAGCASGEEAYTLAILLQEAGLAENSAILGTDISRARLAQARDAAFAGWSLRGVPEAVVRRYFRRRGKRYLLAPRVRAAVTFRHLNLLEDELPFPGVVSGMDLVLCRNVLIYLSAEAVARVAPRLLGSLSPQGWLFLGASDPPLAGLAPCEVVVTDAGIAYRRAGGGSGPPPHWVATQPLTAGPTQTHPPASPTSVSPTANASPSAEARTPAEDAASTGTSGTSPGRATPAELCFAERDYVRAAEIASAGLRLDPSDPRLWELHIRSLARQGKLDEALQGCTEAIAIHRTSAELACLYAMLLSAAGRTDDAARVSRRAIYLERSLIMAHLVLGHSLLQLGNPAAAGRALRAAEKELMSLPPEAIVPASDEEPAARLLELARRQLRLVAAT